MTSHSPNCQGLDDVLDEWRIDGQSADHPQAAAHRPRREPGRASRVIFEALHVDQCG